MSHHGESPQALRYPQLDICDLFVFGGERGTVLIQTLSPLSGPAGFRPDGAHEFNIDTAGGSARDLLFRVTFSPQDRGGGQHLELRLLAGPAAAPAAAGELLASGPTETVIAGRQGTRIWAGRAADPFYIDGNVVSAVARSVQAGEALDVRALMAAPAPANLFAGHDVNAIVLEVPDSLLSPPESATAPGIAVWATTARRDGGTWIRVQRCATPLIPTLFFGCDALADAYNTTDPQDDRENYGPRVRELAGRAAAAAGGTEDPRAHGARVQDELLPDLLRYRPGTPAQFGFAGRNGRGLTDPVAEVMFAIVTGRAVPLGLDASAAAGMPRPAFPYLGIPAGRRKP